MPSQERPCDWQCAVKNHFQSLSKPFIADEHMQALSSQITLSANPIFMSGKSRGSCRPGDSGSAAMTCTATDESTCQHIHLVPLHACICRPLKSCDLQANKWLRTLLADFSALHRDVKRAAILEMMADSNARQQDLKWDILGCCIREGNKVGSYLPDDALHISRVLHEDQDRWSHFSQQFASAGLSRSPVNFSRA